MRTIHLQPNDETAQTLAKAAFPGYNGRKFRVCVTHPSHKFQLESGWSEGSCEKFVIVKLDDMTAVNVSGMDFVGNGFNRMGKEFQLPEGFAIVVHATILGKDAGITIFLLADNAAKLIVAPVELTQNEKIVLAATRSLKSSYGGMSNYRQKESGLSLAVWNETSDALKAKGLLAKNGSVTVDGKNAIGMMGLYEARQS